MTKVTSLSTLIIMKLNAKHQYNKIINKVKEYVYCDDYTVDEKKIILDYVTEVIKRDIQTEDISDLFYSMVKTKDNSKSLEKVKSYDFEYI